MSRFEWNNEMSVGVPSLDTDHRCLIRIINLLDGIGPIDTIRTVDTVLDTLLLYGRFHFAREEKVMKACGFPGRRVHALEHRRFTSFIDRLREGDRAATSRTPRRLYDYLSDWLRHHILIQDMAFKPYVIESEAIQECARQLAPSLTLPVAMAELAAG